MTKLDDSRHPDCPACRADTGRSIELKKVGERCCDRSIIGVDAFIYECGKCRRWWADMLNGEPLIVHGGPAWPPKKP